MSVSSVTNVKQFYKVLDHGFIEVIDVMGSDSDIVRAARMSTSGDISTPERDERLIKYLMKHRHTSPFEMCEIKLKAKMPIFVARQWLRHRTANVNEFSARYSKMDSEFYIPDSLYKQSTSNHQGSNTGSIVENSDELITQMKKSSECQFELYNKLIDAGVSRETARIILPLNTYTTVLWKIDLHNLFHFIKLRNAPDSQYEIREYAKIIEEKILPNWVPIAYSAWKEYNRK